MSATTPAATAARMLYIHAISPLHSGVGQSTGTIDLPVARETITGWPHLPGSAIKGVLRDACEGAVGQEQLEAMFGPPTERASEGAGKLWFTDARLLCLPVRSYHGTFAWISCPLALRRWARDLRDAGLTPPTLPTANPSGNQIFVARGSALALPSSGMVILEDLDLELQSDPVDAMRTFATALAAIAIADATWREEFVPRFGIVSNDIFTFLAETATEVIARVRLDDNKKTVANGALWYEEVVPAETIFACPLLAEPRASGVAGYFNTLSDRVGARTLQIGGNASVGRGLVRLALAG